LFYRHHWAQVNQQFHPDLHVLKHGQPLCGFYTVLQDFQLSVAI